jgi:hypothetical protein
MEHAAFMLTIDQVTRKILVLWLFFYDFIVCNRVKNFLPGNKSAFQPHGDVIGPRDPSFPHTSLYEVQRIVGKCVCGHGYSA